jgi:hypothetical protein
MPFDLYTRIGRPQEGHNVTTPEQYRQYQARLIEHNIERHPYMAWVRPYDAIGVVVAPRIDAGRWIVLCGVCSNAPLYDPDWKLACCCECGAVYAGVDPPEDWEAIETLLMARDTLAARRWYTGITLAQLTAENAAGSLL